jgi:hypothetical protein
MSILTEEEYRELFEVADEYQEMLERLSGGRMDLEDGERPESVEELSDAGAAWYRNGVDGEWYAVASSLGEEVLEHLEGDRSLEEYLNAMERQEEVFDKVYSG